jgi:hypothetical protein
MSEDLTPIAKNQSPIAKAAAPTLEQIEAVEGRLLDAPQVACPLTHLFAPGVYFREIFMPANSFVIGHEHKTEHFNVVLSGHVRVLCGGKAMDLVGPCVFVSKPGVRKVLHVITDTRWATIHPTAGIEHCGQNIDQLEEALRVKSQAFLEHEKGKVLCHS